MSEKLKQQTACVLMGDVTASRKLAAGGLQHWLAAAATDANRHLADHIRSPVTVTLGDEFQTVTMNLETGARLIEWFERRRLASDPGFRLHYALARGRLDTPVNPEIAHGMLGPVLTEARRLLTLTGRSRRFVQVSTGDATTDRLLGNVYDVIDALSGRWKRDDFALIDAMLGAGSDAEIGAAFGKTRSQIWKRRKTLLVDEYGRLAETAVGLAAMADASARAGGMDGA